MQILLSIGGSQVVTADDVIKCIHPRDGDQEKRIRELYTRTHLAFQTSSTAGIRNALESDWGRLKSEFDNALATVKKETGLF